MTFSAWQVGILTVDWRQRLPWKLPLSHPGPFQVGGHEVCDTALGQVGSGTGYVKFLFMTGMMATHKQCG